MPHIYKQGFCVNIVVETAVLLYGVRSEINNGYLKRKRII